MSITRHPLCAARSLRRLADAPLDGQLIQRLQASFQSLGAPETGLAERFYARLFARHPALRAMFPADLARQQEKFRLMLQRVIEDISNPDATLAALEALGRHHAGLGVRPEHYPPVVEILLAALAEAAGPDWTSELAADWGETLALISAAMIEGARGAAAGPGPAPRAPH